MKYVLRCLPLLLLVGANGVAQAQTGLNRVTCLSSDFRTPIWTREYYIELQDHFQNLIVARELIRENGCSLGLKNTIYFGECHSVGYEQIVCR